MPYAHDTYVLALGVLDGQPDAHRILADMLEEQGERGLAQWARVSKSRRTQRVDFLLTLLPARTSLHLGCDFLGHVVEPIVPTSRVARTLLREGLTPIKAWADSNSESEVSARAMVVLQAISTTSSGDAARALQDAVESYRRANELVKSGDDRKAKSVFLNVSNAIRECARISRHIGQRELFNRLWEKLGNNWWRGENARKVKVTELEWQLEQIRAALQSLLKTE